MELLQNDLVVIHGFRGKRGWRLSDYLASATVMHTGNLYSIPTTVAVTRATRLSDCAHGGGDDDYMMAVLPLRVSEKLTNQAYNDGRLKHGSRREDINPRTMVRNLVCRLCPGVMVSGVLPMPSFLSCSCSGPKRSLTGIGSEKSCGSSQGGTGQDTYSEHHSRRLVCVRSKQDRPASNAKFKLVINDAANQQRFSWFNFNRYLGSYPRVKLPGLPRKSMVSGSRSASAVMRGGGVGSVVGEG